MRKIVKILKGGKDPKPTKQEKQAAKQEATQKKQAAKQAASTKKQLNKDAATKKKQETKLAENTKKQEATLQEEKLKEEKKKIKAEENAKQAVVKAEANAIYAADKRVKNQAYNNEKAVKRKSKSLKDATQEIIRLEQKKADKYLKGNELKRINARIAHVKSKHGLGGTGTGTQKVLQTNQLAASPPLSGELRQTPTLSVVSQHSTILKEGLSQSEIKLESQHKDSFASAIQDLTFERGDHLINAKRHENKIKNLQVQLSQIKHEDQGVKKKGFFSFFSKFMPVKNTVKQRKRLESELLKVTKKKDRSNKKVVKTQARIDLLTKKSPGAVLANQAAEKQLLDSNMESSDAAGKLAASMGYSEKNTSIKVNSSNITNLGGPKLELSNGKNLLEESDSNSNNIPIKSENPYLNVSTGKHIIPGTNQNANSRKSHYLNVSTGGPHKDSSNSENPNKHYLNVVPGPNKTYKEEDMYASPKEILAMQQTRKNAENNEKYGSLYAQLEPHTKNTKSSKTGNNTYINLAESNKIYANPFDASNAKKSYKNASEDLYMKVEPHKKNKNSSQTSTNIKNTNQKPETPETESNYGNLARERDIINRNSSKYNPASQYAIPTELSPMKNEEKHIKEENHYNTLQFIPETDTRHPLNPNNPQNLKNAANVAEYKEFRTRTNVPKKGKKTKKEKPIMQTKESNNAQRAEALKKSQSQSQETTEIDTNAKSLSNYKNSSASKKVENERQARLAASAEFQKRKEEQDKIPHLETKASNNEHIKHLRETGKINPEILEKWKTEHQKYAQNFKDFAEFQKESLQIGIVANPEEYKKRYNAFVAERDAYQNPLSKMVSIEGFNANSSLKDRAQSGYLSTQITKNSGAFNRYVENQQGHADMMDRFRVLSAEKANAKAQKTSQEPQGPQASQGTQASQVPKELQEPQAPQAPKASQEPQNISGKFKELQNQLKRENNISKKKLSEINARFNSLTKERANEVQSEKAKLLKAEENKKQAGVNTQKLMDAAKVRENAAQRKLNANANALTRSQTENQKQKEASLTQSIFSGNSSKSPLTKAARTRAEIEKSQKMKEELCLRNI